MKNWQSLFLKIVIIILVLPILFLAFYLFPHYIYLGFQSDSSYAPYLLVLVISCYFIFVPLLMIFYKSFKLLIKIDKKEFFTEETIKSLKFISILAYAITLVLVCDLPFVYIVANMDDAPGLLLIALFITGFVLSFGVLVSLIKTLVKDTILIRGNE